MFSSLKMNHAQTKKDLRFSGWSVSGVLVLTVIFVLTHPYSGIRHDGILYFAQALYRIKPEIFAQDIFFKFGSQESFTVFGRIYAQLIISLGVGAANILLILIAQLGFLSAAIWWIKLLLPRRLGFAGLFAICIASSIYGGAHVFGYAEPFVTARPFAEIFVLIGLASLYQGHKGIAFLLLLLSMAIHPLIGLPGMLLWWFWLIRHNRRWLILVILAPLIFIPAALGVQPFNQLLQFHDAEWRTILEEGAHLFVSRWSPLDWAMMATDVFFICAANKFANEKRRIFLQTVLYVLLAGMLLSVIGVDLLSNVLFTSLQLWRAHWLVHFFAVLVSPLVIWTMWQRGNLGKVVALLLGYALLNRGLWTGLFALPLAAALWGSLSRGHQKLEARWPWIIGVLLLGAQLTMWQNNFHWDLSVIALSSGSDLPIWNTAAAIILKPPIGPLLLVAPLFLLWWKFGLQRRWVQGLVSIVAVTIMIMGWDQRGAWAKMMEQFPMGEHPFSDVVSPTQDVYWRNNPLAPWLLMGRRSYYSGEQSAGQLFNRPTAVELTKRRKVMGIFEFQEIICGMMNKLNNDDSSCEPDIEAMRNACEVDSALGYIVSTYNINEEWIKSWQPTIDGQPYGKKFYLFSCQRLKHVAVSKG
jgi:hypothetical protein